MNRNYRMRIGSDDVVLRFYDRSWRAARREAAIFRAARGRIDVREVLYTATDRRPTPFIVLEYVDAISLRELKARGDHDAVAQAAYDAGRQLAALRSVAVNPDVRANQKSTQACSRDRTSTRE